MFLNRIEELRLKQKKRQKWLKIIQVHTYDDKKKPYLQERRETEPIWDRFAYCCFCTGQISIKNLDEMEKTFICKD